MPGTNMNVDTISNRILNELIGISNKPTTMKKILCMIACLLTGLSGFAQTIFTANSNPGAVGGTNVFTGATAIVNAVNAAATGDIIYIVPSSVIYSSPNLTKSVSLIGGGFNPDQPGANVVTIDFVVVNSGNTRLSGIVIREYIHFPVSVSNIMIDKCRFKSVTVQAGQAVANVIIQNCILGENGSGAILFLQSTSSNIKISNNIIYATFSGTIAALNAAVIENNVFVGSGSAFNTVANCDIKNNIFYGVTPAGSSNTNNDQRNNLSYNTSDNLFPSANGNTSTNNITGQNPLFVNLPFAAPFTFSYDVHLQAGSPAIGTGLGGTDMGLFGGTNPYDVYGTSLPTVQSIVAPNTVTQGTNMNVRIQATGN